MWASLRIGPRPADAIPTSPVGGESLRTPAGAFIICNTIRNLGPDAPRLLRRGCSVGETFCVGKVPTDARSRDARSSSGEGKLRVGVSSCLLGVKVRYDGEHKRDAVLIEQLGPFVEWVPVCPEVEVGMGVPREAVRLLRGKDAEVRMVGTRSGADWTARMRRFAEERVRALDDLCGYVVKSKSPSCGLERVEVYALGEDGRAVRPGVPARDGVGLFVAALRRRWPNLPVEDESRLRDRRLREDFIERLFAYHRVLTSSRTPRS